MKDRERIWEKVLKPIRINPPAAISTLTGISAIGASQQLIDTGHPAMGAIGILSGTTVMAFSLPTYRYALGEYRRCREMVECYGDRAFRKASNTYLSHYCNRQAFYVAGVEHGFRDEARHRLKQVPENMKIYKHIPHF